ncbi:MAG: monofunctional biosynthetic peptidoglycan transglycosylase [Terrimonas sp.]|nr:monofunctional biosynthetic peptidoglycan transglycosylase [Terrimonas sp.]
MNTKGLVPRLWRKFKRFVFWLFIFQFFYILFLKWVNPPITITQLVSWISGDGLQRDYVGRYEVSPYLKLAVIASEDQLFPDHSGFDWKSIKKAQAYNKRKPGRIHGASTISQQTAKNVFLWQGRSWFRKGLETYFTFMIEWIWGKKRILEVYLNVIEMGKGIYGAEAAARHYFNKPVSMISRQEAAMIAACLPNPKKYTVKPPSSYVSRRWPEIMRQMNNLIGDPDVQKIIYKEVKGNTKGK